ncbi:hypothetical protein B0H14DRAFT_2634167 [Mycena olivaceomarginata]|nr:hypothetical protein B0H14DRAFT_2634167 [Mycena olivaceomarginata]
MQSRIPLPNRIGRTPSPVLTAILLWTCGSYFEWDGEELVLNHRHMPNLASDANGGFLDTRLRLGHHNSPLHRITAPEAVLLNRTRDLKYRIHVTANSVTPLHFVFLLRLYSLRVGGESLLLTTLDLVVIYEQRKLNGGFSVLPVE